jgi:hypothetical protein
MAAASTFTNEAAANRAQGRFVKKYKLEIEKWLADGTKQEFGKSFNCDFFYWKRDEAK